MSAYVFDGIQEAGRREQVLREQISKMQLRPRLLSLLFTEDPASSLYVELKHEAAVRVGVEFDRVDGSFGDDLELLSGRIRLANQRTDVHGVMVQKPSKQVWEKAMGTGTTNRSKFEIWWRTLANTIAPGKDVDCLNQINLDKVYAGEETVLPATVKAVLLILERALEVTRGTRTVLVGGGGGVLSGMRVAVVGRSDIVGKPLSAVLQRLGATVSLVGSGTEELGVYTVPAQIVVSATGVPHLIGEDVVSEGAIVIDVGSPRGDVDFETVSRTASFITPVPNGVGPMTVVSLLENLVGV